MSLINGDKSRSGRQRKAKMAKRIKNEALRQSLQKAAPAKPAK